MSAAKKLKRGSRPMTAKKVPVSIAVRPNLAASVRKIALMKGTSDSAVYELLLGLGLLAFRLLYSDVEYREEVEQS